MQYIQFPTNEAFKVHQVSAMTKSGKELQLKLIKNTGKLGKPIANDNVKKEGLEEVSPPGWSGTVKAMKKNKKITNPFALAWSMKNKGYKSHQKED